MQSRPLMIDAHQDLAWNMLSFGRDYTRSAAETRQLEEGSLAVQVNGDTLLGWPDYQQAHLGVIFATLFAVPERLRTGDWETQCYADISQANRLYRAQLDCYHRLVDNHPDKFRLVQSRKDLGHVIQAWDMPTVHGETSPDPSVGLVILMEGAEGVRAPAELEEWWDGGVRIIGPAWAGNRFCGGTNEPGGLTRAGHELLEQMADLGFGLDISHMDEAAALQALEMYPGRVCATHSNARALLKDGETNRQLTDTMIRSLIERDGVIGVVPYNRFLNPAWKISDGREVISLRLLASQIDYICQMAGDARHVGLGTDLDGGFGWQSTPVEIGSLVDFHILGSLMAQKGYSEPDISAIFSENWLKFLKETLPEST